jgi:hypothetical protein
MGDNGGMRPEEAERFYEADEDPEKIFAAFDAAEKGVTGPPRAWQASGSSRTIYVVARGLYRDLRQNLLPEVSAAGHRAYISGHA